MQKEVQAAKTANIIEHCNLHHLFSLHELIFFNVYACNWCKGLTFFAAITTLSATTEGPEFQHTTGNIFLLCGNTSHLSCEDRTKQNKAINTLSMVGEYFI